MVTLKLSQTAAGENCKPFLSASVVPHAEAVSPCHYPAHFRRTSHVFWNHTGQGVPRPSEPHRVGRSSPFRATQGKASHAPPSHTGQGIPRPPVSELMLRPRILRSWHLVPKLLQRCCACQTQLRDKILCITYACPYGSVSPPFFSRVLPSKQCPVGRTWRRHWAAFRRICRSTSPFYQLK